MDSISTLADLGPALGSVVVLAVICYNLIKMMNEHTKTISELNVVIRNQSVALDRISSNQEKLGENMRENTEVVRTCVRLVEQKT